jgi:valine--pyruvate aminotransferase
MQWSAFGERFAGESGIVELMDDLGDALSNNPDTIFMGGGNPGRVHAVEALFQRRLEAILADPAERHQLFGVYQSPLGDRGFRRQLAGFLKREYGWPVGENNIAVSNGSQSAFFLLFNLLAGSMPDGGRRRIHLPLTPEYVGYADTGLTDGLFSATRPGIEYLPDGLFKYRVDFSELQPGPEVAALCVSRPTNPTGNVLTDEEIEHLDEIARRRGVPLIIDGAYGLPFPGILFTDARPHWNDNTILALSLSKLGLPGVRTGILVAREELIQAYARANTIVSLACSTLGPALARGLFESGEILALTRDQVAPFYRRRARLTVEGFRRELAGLPCHIHRPEGAIFLWLWCEGLPGGSHALYQRLKERGVLVVPGDRFFIGVEDDWAHRRECLRVSYAGDPAQVQRGVAIIGEELRRAYRVA